MNRPPRPAPRELTVLAKTQLTPHMLRITLGGVAMAEFPLDQASAYVKLIWPTEPEVHTIMRTYTIGAQRNDSIDLDFVLHDEAGPASQWARNVTVGESILVGGPGAKKLLEPEADFVVLAGDMTALPALAVNLAQLPQNAQGHCFIEIISQEDVQMLTHPSGVQLHWLINPVPGTQPELLANAIAAHTWPASNIGLWAACEFSSMRAIRALVRQRLPARSANVYISSYWKLGATEDQHKVSKREDAQTQ